MLLAHKTEIRSTDTRLKSFVRLMTSSEVLSSAIKNKNGTLLAYWRLIAIVPYYAQVNNLGGYMKKFLIGIACEYPTIVFIITMAIVIYAFKVGL